MPKLKEQESLGERLRKRREELEMTIESVAHEVQSPIKYIAALEADNYEAFSVKVYAVGYLKRLCRALTMEDTDRFLKEFGTEWDVRMFRKRQEPMSLPKNRGEEPLITPARLVILTVGIGLVLFLFFFGIRLTRFLGTPTLTLLDPKDREEFSSPVVPVRGTVEKESRLTVNGREIKIDERGRFDEKIELGSGAHSLEFIVESRFGKTTSKVRQVLIK